MEAVDAFPDEDKDVVCRSHALQDEPSHYLTRRREGKGESPALDPSISLLTTQNFDAEIADDAWLETKIIERANDHRNVALARIQVPYPFSNRDSLIEIL